MRSAQRGRLRRLTQRRRVGKAADVGAGVNLEVIARPAAVLDGRERPPLLFVHGICHGAWCWDEHFLDFFAARGWDAYALSLRGHGNSEGASDVGVCRIADYVADVRSVADSLAGWPVLIGHSMGGFIVQKYLACSPAPAAVLLASMPPRGGLRSPLLRHSPLLAISSLARGQIVQMFATSSRCRAAFFSPGTSEVVVDRCRRRLTNESPRAVFDMLIADRPQRGSPDVPMLVMGAAQDAIFSPAQVHATASRYQTQAVIIENTGHNMMLENTWRTTAQHINAWLTATVLPLRMGQSH